MKIAVLNNDAAELKIICSILNSTGHNALPLSSGKELQNEHIDMLIVDSQSSDVSAVKVITSVREKFASTFPILFIAKSFAEEEIVDAIAADATDYIIKPIRRNELLTRVEVLLRRAYPNQSPPENLEFGHYIFETRSGRISLSGQFIKLTRKEFDLALLLFRNLGKPLSRATILEAIWSCETDIPSRTLDTHISRVRTKLQLRPENGFRLAPVYSYGYRLDANNIRRAV